MHIILIYKKLWESARWNFSFSACRVSAPKTFGSERSVFAEAFSFPPAIDHRHVIFVHANDTDRWGRMKDKVSVGEIEEYYRNDLVALLPFTTLEENGRRGDEPVYGARAIGRLMAAIADGQEFRDADAVRRCLDGQKPPPSVDAVQALAILCQGYILATIAADPVHAEGDEVKDALEKIGLKDLAGGAVVLKIAAERAEEGRRPSWWTSVFPTRPDLGGIQERPEVRRLLDAFWGGGGSEAPSLDPSAVARAYLALLRP